MSLCKILVHYPNSENWQEGDIVEISNPNILIVEGKVELYTPETPVVPEVVEPKPEAKKKTFKNSPKKKKK
jgi:hypothetical protein